MGTTRPVAIATIAALLSGCATTLDVRNDGAQRPYAEGVVQVLPFTQYEVTATWQLISCDQPVIDGGYKNLALSVEAVPGEQEDPGQRYLIDPTSLQQPLTRSDFGVSYFEDSNTIKAVNAEVEDRTAQFVANVVTTVAKVAAAAGGVPGLPLSESERALVGSPPIPPAPPPIVPLCSDSARQTLAQVATLEAALDAANEQVDSANKEVARLTTVAQLVWEVDADMARELAAALKRQDEAVGAQAKLKSQLEKALEAVTARVAIRWPQNGGEFDRAEPLLVPESALAKWFSQSPAPDAWPGSFLAIRPSTGVMPTGLTAVPPGRVRGIPYRLHARGRLLTCDLPCNKEEAAAEVLVEGNVAQLGGVKILRVRNPALGSTAFEAEFNRDATLVSTGSAQREAPLEVASGMVAGAATTLAPLLDPVERAKRETAYYNAIKERNEARDGLKPAAVDPVAEASATFQAKTTLLDSERLMIEAQIARDQALARIGQP